MWQHFYGKHTLSLSLSFFFVFLKSICNWPLCPVHLALSFNLQAHWVSLESNQPGDFGTRMKGPRGPKCNFSFLPRLKPRWWAVGIQWRLIACRALTVSQKRVIKSDTCFGKGHWLLRSDLWRNMCGPLLIIRSLLSLMNSRLKLIWPSRQF